MPRHAPTCPLKDEPLTEPGQVISRAAAQDLANRCNNLAELLELATQCVAGAGSTPAPVRTQPRSQPPINLSLLEQVDEWRDLIDEWANAYLSWARPQARLRPGDWRSVQGILTGTTVPLDQMTRYPEAPAMYQALTGAIKALKRLVRWDPTTWIPLGPCPNCEHPVSAAKGEATAKCYGCGSSLDIESRKLELRQNISDLYLTRSAAREAARVYAGLTIPDATLKTWQARGKITPVRSADGLLFNVGQLIEQATNEPH